MRRQLRDVLIAARELDLALDNLAAFELEPMVASP
jgi:hypothetical protein